MQCTACSREGFLPSVMDALMDATLETLVENCARESLTTQDHNRSRKGHQKRSLQLRDASQAQNLPSNGPAVPCKKPRTTNVAYKAVTAPLPNASNASSVCAHDLTGVNPACLSVAKSMIM